MKYVIRGADADERSPVGGKAGALAVLARAGLPVPPWFALTPEAFSSGELLPEAETELAVALAELCPAGEPVAVRSSAEDEDGTRASFAGQLDSFLNVAPADVALRAADVWRSASGERVLAYRRAHDLPPPRPPAVLVQRMVDAEVSGVAFGADPVGGRRDVVVVAAVFGLGTALVSGDGDADTYHVDGGGHVVARTIATKATADRPAPAGGLQTVPVPDGMAARPALDDARAAAVAALARRAGDYFGRPQDVEWALAGGRLYLLQSRPITTLDRTPSSAEPATLWDNSNISESYGGVTTPLTFSFARTVYEAVYREFCRLLRVPDDRLEANADVFRRMLGLVRGRVYYNLLSWYRALALLPGFRANRRFMEQMMGVREGLPDVLVEELAGAGRLARWRDRFHLLRSVAAQIRGHLTLGRRVRAFRRRLDDALATVPANLTELRTDELAGRYRELERRLLLHWDAPLLNDFLAMIFHGVLGKLARAWCGDADGSLRNELLRGGGGMISAEPAARVRVLAEVAATNPKLVDALTGGTPESVEEGAAAVPRFRELLAEYLAKFADRCPGELKLESLTLADDPSPLLRAVGALAKGVARGEAPPLSTGDAERAAAERRVRLALRWRPLRRLVFGWVLRTTRARLRDREDLRFGRTRLFGQIRRLFAELGRRFHAAGALADPRDVFYLDANEAWGYLDGTATTANLKGLVRVRQAEFEDYRRAVAPPGRFETRGPVPLSDRFERPGVVPDGDRRQGLGCCPGVVRGPVRVVADPRAAELSRGEILVAERTDPGWVVLFPAAAGLLVERGSLLSHSAVVSRELGLPAVVSVPGLTRWLRDGDWVELDGGTGLVTRLGPDAVGRTHGE